VSVTNVPGGIDSDAYGTSKLRRARFSDHRRHPILIPRRSLARLAHSISAPVRLRRTDCPSSAVHVKWPQSGGNGVDPDVLVEISPDALANGQDNQVTTAVDIVNAM